MSTIAGALSVLGSILGSSSSTSKTDSTSFADAFEAASVTGSREAKHAAAGQASLDEFKRYASETPEQRMFDNWLQSQDISQSDYNAMTPQQQQALHDKFEEQIRDKLTSDAEAKLTSAK